MQKSQRGFTIVELLIVIVVIAILAAIVIVAYSGIQNKAADNRRLNDMQEIQSAIESYKVANGALPAITTANVGLYGWETSSTTGSFLDTIKSNGIVRQIPVDPINNSTYYYRYFVYAAGSYGCDATRGNFYVLEIEKFQAGGLYGTGPGFSCSGRNWATEDAQWVTGGYTN